MKIDLLFITTSLGHGGAEAALYRLVTQEEIRSRGVAVISLADDGIWGAKLKAFDIPVLTLNLGTSGLCGAPRAVAQLGRMVRELNPRLVQGWMYHGNLAASTAWVLGLRRHRKVAWAVRHALHAPEQGKFLTSALIKSAALVQSTTDAIIFNSTTAALQHQAIGYPEHKSQVIPHGVDFNEFRADASRRESARARWGVAPDCRVVGTLARYHPHKDFPTLMRAAARVLRAVHDRLEVKFVISGHGVDPTNCELTSLIESEGIAQAVILAGVTDAPAEVIPGFDLALLTSRTEALPNFGLEALACGVPLVAPAVGDCADLMVDTAQCTRVNDPDHVAEVVAALLCNDERRAKIGQQSRHRAQQRYSISAAAQAYSALYDQLLAEPR